MKLGLTRIDWNDWINLDIQWHVDPIDGYTIDQLFINHLDYTNDAAALREAYKAIAVRQCVNANRTGSPEHLTLEYKKPAVTDLRVY